MASRQHRFVILLIAIVASVFAFYCVLFYKGKQERELQIRNLIYSSLPNVMSQNVTALCKSNAVTSAELFVVSEDRVFLCYEIDKRFYCLQQTGQLLNFQDKEFAIKAIKPRSVRCLYNIDKSVPQSPDEISSWMIKEEYLLQDTSHNLGDAKGGPHGH